MKCPQCGRIKAVQKAGDLYHCNGCGATFDDEVNEHGRALHNDPVRAAQLRENIERRGGRLGKQR